MVTNLRYTGDTTVITGTKEELLEIMEIIRKTSEKAGLYLIVLNAKVMMTGEVTVDGKIVEVVKSFVFLGALITRYGLCDKEICRGYPRKHIGTKCVKI